MKTENRTQDYGLTGYKWFFFVLYVYTYLCVRAHACACLCVCVHACQSGGRIDFECTLQLLSTLFFVCLLINITVCV